VDATRYTQGGFLEGVIQNGPKAGHSVVETGFGCRKFGTPSERWTSFRMSEKKVDTTLLAVQKLRFQQTKTQRAFEAFDSTGEK
jgi:hypothetical protein